MKALGICVGASSVKATILSENNVPQSGRVAHHGNVPEAVLQLVREFGVNGSTKVLGTGTEGRKLLNFGSVIEAISVESAVAGLKGNPDAVVSLGGEDFVVYTLQNGKITNTFSGDKCASGTGEFFRQQLLRMDMTLEDANRPELQGKVCGLSTRCSVFMKSDCTHRLNKGEATKSDIVLSLVFVMATKIADFLIKARIFMGSVWLVGGVTQNRHLLGFLKEKLPKVDFSVPEHATVFESYGAACLALEIGEALPQELIRPNTTRFDNYPSLAKVESRVRFMSTKPGTLAKGKEYVLGVDGGSTTTKIALIDPETLEICASHYGRTHGNPVDALQKCVQEVMEQAKKATGDSNVKIGLCAATGSSRELLGAYLATSGVYNEIIAHATATAYYDSEIDTLFEIGGQDAKYVYLRNGVPIDYAMNEACSAGTGSFLEESAHSDLDIHSAPDIGPVAMKAEYSLKFGEHCSAFINSDIRKAIQWGAPREAIVGGLVHSIVSNYLNRVVGNRRIGGKVALQGGVAKNSAVPLAFASILGKDIMVPPAPELLGAFGVALMAIDKNKDGLLSKGDYNLQKILDTSFSVEREFKCKSCENDCPIKILSVGGKKSYFGGRCNKYANMRKNIDIESSKSVDYTKVREEMLFQEFAPTFEELEKNKSPIIGIPMAFTVYNLWPLFATFFHELGVKVVVSRKILKEGIQRCESSFCYPGEIAHGAFADLLDKGCDYYFLPHVKMMPSYTEEVHACTCPVTQGMAYYLRTAFEIDDRFILRPLIRMQENLEEGESAFVETAVRVGCTTEQGRMAFRKGLAQYRAFLAACQKKGKEILAETEKTGKVAIAILGRPYNAFATDANMEIPKKIQTRGYTVIPFDFLPVDGKALTPNMYWYYGQQDVGAAAYVKKHPNLFMCYISNFSCAPDSFLLHIMHWMMGIKPFLVLEIDSHTADAGVDTRIEAFLDIIDGFRKSQRELREAPYKQQWDVSFKGGKTTIHNKFTGENMDIRDPRITMVWPSMGRYSSQGMSAVTESVGIKSTFLPVADYQTTQLARNVASGKECIPTLLVLGSILQFLSKNKPSPDQIYVIMVPKTTGPCRTGQYAYFYERTFHHIALDNVVVLVLSSDNSYMEMGPEFSKAVLWELYIADAFRDMHCSLQVLAEDKEKALLELEEAWLETVAMFKARRWNDMRELSRITQRIKKIPLKKKLSDVEKVLIVGEIYVRRDDFSVTQLIESLSEKGIVGKIAGLMEWIHYTDYLRKIEIERNVAKVPSWRRYFSRPFADLMKLKAEFWYKHKAEEKVLEVLKPTGLIPDTPHHMDKIMKRAPVFTHPFFATETTISTCVAVEAMETGAYQGIVGIAPFACLIGRVIKSLLGPYMRKNGYPFLALENDGFTYSPALLSRLEVFILSVLRFGQKKRGVTTFDKYLIVEKREKKPPTHKKNLQPV